MGERVHYSATEHPSVGYTFAYTITKPAVVALLEKQEVYEQPNPKLRGGDGERVTTTLIFEAKQPVKTIIKITHFFRGEEKERHLFDILVLDERLHHRTFLVFVVLILQAVVFQKQATSPR
ncbi:hypothetical protein [Eisenibacter elegans]|uniref:hypothetical protein n=1 Tax=Eisenibacter elegans TaxID=997 RepID=UPI0004797513|nr:hypothetical protein [Eisenibacter elegans]